VVLVSISLAVSQTPAYTAKPWTPWLVYCLVGYPLRDGQAELTWVNGYILRWLSHPQMLTNPSTNRAWCRATNVDQDQRIITKTNHQLPWPAHFWSFVLYHCIVQVVCISNDLWMSCNFNNGICTVEWTLRTLSWFLKLPKNLFIKFS